MSSKNLSLVVPVFNEAENLAILFKKIFHSLGKLPLSWEIIAINDGSTDQSSMILDKLAQKKSKLKVIHFSKNFGQTAAVAAGIKHAQGKIIILMDADLQNDAADIPRLLEKIKQGYDVVSGWRANRQDPWTRTLPSVIANKIISLTTGVKIHDTGCSLKAYKKEVFDNFALYGEMHRFLPALAHIYGAKITEIKVKHHPRKYGRSKYGILRTFKVLLDLLTLKFFGSYSTKPIYVFGGGGFLLLFLGFLATIFIIIRRLFFGGQWVSPMLFIAVLLFTVSVQLILMGLLAEIMIRTYFESLQRPIYKISKKSNFS